jgi:hypothetical protein
MLVNQKLEVEVRARRERGRYEAVANALISIRQSSEGQALRSVVVVKIKPYI